MESDRNRQAIGPGGALADRVGDQVAATEQVLQQSRQAIERITARIEETRRHVQHTSRRVLDTASATRAAHRSATVLTRRFLKVKRRELTAHLAAVRLHEGAAELQDGLGHPERAAQARTKAEQAWAWYRLAGEELTEYQGRIKAATEKAGKASKRSL